jgi:NADH-quinone oxidoreductase subunit E
MEQKSLIDELHNIQEAEEENYLPPEKVIKVSEKKKIPAAKAFGVSTFYTMFSVKPRGKHIIRICRNLSCHLEGAETIVEKLKIALGVDFGETTEDGEFTLEESSCLGMCSVSPAMMIDEQAFGNLTPEKIPEILKKVKEGDKK